MSLNGEVASVEQAVRSLKRTVEKAAEQAKQDAEQARKDAAEPMVSIRLRQLHEMKATIARLSVQSTQAYRDPLTDTLHIKVQLNRFDKQHVTLERVMEAIMVELQKLSERVL